MRSDGGLRTRLVLAAVLAGIWIALAVTGLALQATRNGALALLHATGFAAAHSAAKDLFVVGTQPYRVSFGCTPVGISLCLLGLLACAPLAPRAFLVAAIAVTSAAGPMMVVNTVVSVHLHQGGVSWLWAHYPGSAAVYAVLLGAAWRLARRGGGGLLVERSDTTCR